MLAQVHCFSFAHKKKIADQTSNEQNIHTHRQERILTLVAGTDSVLKCKW